MIIDCQKIANEIKVDLKDKIDTVWLNVDYGPYLVIIQVGNNQASNAYIKGNIQMISVNYSSSLLIL